MIFAGRAKKRAEAMNVKRTQLEGGPARLEMRPASVMTDLQNKNQTAIAGMDMKSEHSTQLHGRRLLVARLAWLGVVLMSIWLFIAGLFAYHHQISTLGFVPASEREAMVRALS